MRKSSLRSLTTGAATALLLACGGDDPPGPGPDRDTSTEDVPVEVTLPTDCYLPEAPTAELDCAFMCEKVSACGLDEASCLSDCAAFAFMLSPEAGAGVERCFIDLPCNDHPAFFGAIGCVANLKEDPDFSAPAVNTAMCDEVTARAASCGLSAELGDAMESLCDLAGHALAPELVTRARECASASCETFSECLASSSCFWDGIVPVDDAIPDERDACLNSRDDNAIGTSDAIGEALACVDGCPSGSFWCAQGCVTDTSGMTGPCSTCFTLLGRCMRASCEGPCTEPQSAACHACQTEAGCADDFRVCAGRSILGGPDDAIDCNAQEQAEIRDEAMVENATKCVFQCSDGPTCNAECMEALVMVGSCCLGCAGVFATCAGRECAT